MATEIKMPKNGMDMTEGVIVRWLKNVGDKVSGGEVIGTMGKRTAQDDDTKKHFLHLELWHRGKPLDPNTYIAF